jgi:hypothetical protein
MGSIRTGFAVHCLALAGSFTYRPYRTLVISRVAGLAQSQLFNKKKRVPALKTNFRVSPNV